VHYRLFSLDGNSLIAEHDISKPLGTTPTRGYEAHNYFLILTLDKPHYLVIFVNLD
jgi:hypothetical protein